MLRIVRTLALAAVVGLAAPQAGAEQGDYPISKPLLAKYPVKRVYKGRIARV